MTSLPATTTGVEALTARLSTADLYTLIAASMNALDSRGEDLAPDRGYIQGTAATVVWDTDTERYVLEVQQDTLSGGSVALTLLDAAGEVLESASVGVCVGDAR